MTSKLLEREAFAGADNWGGAACRTGTSASLEGEDRGEPPAASAGCLKLEAGTQGAHSSVSARWKGSFVKSKFTGSTTVASSRRVRFIRGRGIVFRRVDFEPGGRQSYCWRPFQLKHRQPLTWKASTPFYPCRARRTGRPTCPP